MLEYEIGLSTGCFYRTNIFEVLEPIRESGFSVLEVSASISHLDYHNRPLVREAANGMADLGLEVRSYHAPFGSGIDISSSDADILESSMAEITAAAAAAVLLGARYFVLHPGPDLGRQGRAEEIHLRQATAVGALARIARICRDYGLIMLLENMLPHQLFGRRQDLLSFREALDSEVGICFDTGHANLAGDIYTAAEELALHMKMIHAHDNLEEDDHLPPGRGRIDWRRLLAVLASSGFKGFITLELSGEHEEEPAVFLAQARQAREFLVGLFEPAA